MLDPSMVLIGGGLTDAAGDLIVDPARAAFAGRASLPGVRPVVPVRRAALGNAAGLVGAAVARDIRCKANETSTSPKRW